MIALDFLQTPLGTILVAGPLVSIVGALTSVLIDVCKKWQVYRRLKKDPYVYEGATILAIKGLNMMAPLIDSPVVLTSLRYGRIELQTAETTETTRNREIYVLTGREFDALVPVFIGETS